MGLFTIIRDGGSAISNDTSKMRTVLDTNVLFSGLVSPRGASFHILDLIVEGECICLATTALWAEYEEQLSSQRFHQLTLLSIREVDDVLDFLASIVEPVHNDFVWRGILPDEDDAIVVETAFNGNADALITFNTGHFQAIGDQVSFRIQHPGDFLKSWKEHHPWPRRQ